MVFKVSVIGSPSGDRIVISVVTESIDRVEQIRRFARKNKYQFSCEVIDR